MTSYAGRLFAFLVAATALDACAGRGATPVVPLQAQTGSALRQTATRSTDSGQFLFLSHYAFPSGGVSEFRLPIHDHERATARAGGMRQPAAVTADARHLYVGSYNVGTIYTYDLPLTKHATPELFSAPTGVSGLACSGRYIYVAQPSGVLEYRLPLVAGEKPSGQIGGYGSDFIGLAARNGTLFVASSIEGTVSGYHLPLRHAPPYFTIQMKPEIDSSVRLVVGLDGTDLYVARTWDSNVYDFRLPYHANEVPTIVSLGWSNYAGGLGVSHDHIFVTVGKEVRAYPLPLFPFSAPDASMDLPYDGGALSISE